MVSIDRILCPVDLSSCSRTALRHALALARWYDAKVTVLHVFRQVPMVDTAAAGLGAGIYAGPVMLTDIDRAAVERRVAEFVAATPGADGVAVHVCEGTNVREEIVRQPAERTIQVFDTASRLPLPQCYVKVYTQGADGEAVFHKDGYTDLRGKFDYLSHTGASLGEIRRVAVLISHPEKGARIEIFDL